jgi:hypothetical protein
MSRIASAKDEAIFNMRIAIRRLLLLVDRRRSAARFAAQVLVQVDQALERQGAVEDGPDGEPSQTTH